MNLEKYSAHVLMYSVPGLRPSGTSELSMRPLRFIHAGGDQGEAKRRKGSAADACAWWIIGMSVFRSCETEKLTSPKSPGDGSSEYDATQ